MKCVYWKLYEQTKMDGSELWNDKKATSKLIFFSSCWKIKIIRVWSNWKKYQNYLEKWVFNMGNNIINSIVFLSQFRAHWTIYFFFSFEKIFFLVSLLYWVLVCHSLWYSLRFLSFIQKLYLVSGLFQWIYFDFIFA